MDETDNNEKKSHSPTEMDALFAALEKGMEEIQIDAEKTLSQK